MPTQNLRRPAIAEGDDFPSRPTDVPASAEVDALALHARVTLHPAAVDRPGRRTLASAHGRLPGNAAGTRARKLSIVDRHGNPPGKVRPSTGRFPAPDCRGIFPAPVPA